MLIHGPEEDEEGSGSEDTGAGDPPDDFDDGDAG